MDRTEATIRNLLTALPAPGYDLGILNEKRMYRLEAVQVSRILPMLRYLKYRNANGAHIYIRPTGESAYTLLDDLSPASIDQLEVKGFAPAAVVETSPDSFQAWLRHEQPLSKDLGTIAAKTLAEEFGADRSAADWRRFGRAPGFTNRKPQHRNALGFYPFAQLHSHIGQPFAEAGAFHARISALQRTVEEERAAIRHSFESRPPRLLTPVSLSRFRTSQRYVGIPAAADMAFCIAACSQGWALADIAAELSHSYLSRDTNPSRHASYINRTITKALRWAA
jgi:hypothetical protein